MKSRSDPTDVGVRVLAALDFGRARAHAIAAAQREKTDRIVRRALDIDIMAGHPKWGRATRIARTTRLNRRTVTDALARLFYAAEMPEQNRSTSPED